MRETHGIVTIIRFPRAENETIVRKTKNKRCNKYYADEALPMIDITIARITHVKWVHKSYVRDSSQV